MDTYLPSITKSPSDKFWMRSRILERIPKQSTVYVDPAFSSDLLVYVKPWDAMILRPVTQYEYRLLHALLELGPDHIDEIISLFKEKKPFTFGTTYRPRILTSISDAELIAHAVSTSEVTVTSYYGVTRYKTKEKREIDLEKIIASVLRANKVLTSTDVHIIAPRAHFPQHLVGQTDITILNMDVVQKDVFTRYMDKLSIEGKLVMVIGKNIYGGVEFTKDYNVETFSRKRGADISIIRNYQI